MKASVLLIGLLVVAIALSGCTRPSDFAGQAIEPFEKSEAVAAFYGALKTKDYDSLNPYYSKELLETISSERMTLVLGMINDLEGSLRSYKVTNVEREAFTPLAGDGFEKYVLTVEAEYERGKSVEYLSLIKENGSLRILGWGTESGEIQDYIQTMLLLDASGAKDDYDAMVSIVNDYFEKREVNRGNFRMLLYRAGSYGRLEQNNLAINDYELMVPFIKELGNVEQRDYSKVFFSLGFLYAEAGNKEKAVERYKYGLQLEPQSNYYQIQLGQIYENLGMKEEALQHYNETKSTLPLVNEEKALVQMKIDRLSGQEPETGFEIPESYSPNFSITIVPINGFDSVNLSDMCMLIKSKFRVGCQVIQGKPIPEAKTLSVERNQYDAHKIVSYLAASLSEASDEYKLPIAITSHDMYSDTANFTFSIQDFDEDIGVISSYMFETSLPVMTKREQEMLLGRRIGIQFISTVGQLMGLERPTNPVCPISYVNSIDDFSQKSSKLCEESQQAVDEMVERVKDWQTPFTEQEKKEITAIYKKYYFE